MLGYVKTVTSELRVREHTFYRALYCGLCKRMGKCTGNCSRLTLSYDFVFLAALRLSVTGEVPTLKKQRCLLHPFHPRPMVQQCDALDFCADASALLSYHKLTDDLCDERGLKKLRAALARPFLSGAYKKAKRRHPSLDSVIAERLSRISHMETGEAAFEGADALAAQFGKLMEAVFSEGLTDADARIAGTVGRSVGHWIYLIDAADDFDEDLKKGRFNPYRKLFGDEMTDTDRETLRLALTVHLLDADRAFALIDTYPAPELKEILANILYLGLPATAERVTGKQDEKEPTNDTSTTSN